MDFQESLKVALRRAFVEKFSDGDERPCNNDDFTKVKKYHENNITYLLKIVDAITTTESTNKNLPKHLSNNILSCILIICGENTCLKPWNTEKTVHNCQLIMEKTLMFFNYRDVRELFNNQKGNKLVNNILQIIRPKLLPTTWKYYPATVTMYKWLLEMIVQPELGYHLPIVLATALLLVDDYINENRITGIHCLNHIIKHSTLAELQFQGYGNVIYNALISLVRIRDSELINEVIPCIANLTSKLEINLGNKTLIKWSRFDEIFEIYMENMQFEAQIDLRNSYIRNLFFLLNVCDLHIIRWSKRLFKIIMEYLQAAGKHDDNVTVSNCLKVMERFINVIQSAHPKIRKRVAFLLLNALHCIPNSDPDKYNENCRVIVKLITQVNSLTKADIQELKLAFEKNLLTDLKLYNLIVRKLLLM